MASIGLLVSDGAAPPSIAQSQPLPSGPGVKPGASPQKGDRETGRESLKDKEAAGAPRSKSEANGQKREQARQEPRKIVVTNPRVQDLVVPRQYAGMICARRHIAVLAPVRGIITAIPVREGQTVKKGEVLFTLSPALYQAKLDAELAEVRLVEIELGHAKKLANDRVISRQEAELVEAKLAKARAKAKFAELEFNLCAVRAPFDGLVGRIRKQEGAGVEEDIEVTTLSDNSEVWVYSNLPELRYLELKDVQKELVGTQAELLLANGSRWPQVGKLAALDAKFGIHGVGLSFRTDFPNPGGLLRHGQSGTVLLHESLKDAVVIPQRATFEDHGKRYVYIVGMDDVAHRREVVIRCELDDIFVTKGLGVGDRIILDGVHRVHDGEKVEYEFRKPDEGPMATPNRARK